MCAIPQLVSAPLNPIPIAEHFRRSHPQYEHSYNGWSDKQYLLIWKMVLRYLFVHSDLFIICQAAERRGKYLVLFTNTEVNNRFSIERFSIEC